MSTDKKPSLVDNDVSVRLLRKWLNEGTYSAREVPALVKDICRKGRWRVRVDEQTGQRWEFERFEDFVTAPLLAGLNTDVDTIEKLCGDDADAHDALDEALQRKAGGNNPSGVNQHKRSEEVEVDIINFNQDAPKRPTGTSRDQALRKLRTEAEKSSEVKEVYEQVLAGEISPHRGMVQCGFRKVKTPLEQVRSLWKKLSAEEQQAFLQEISRDDRS